MNKKLKWGVIGAGGIAYRRTIPEGIIPARNATLIAVMDVNKEVAKKVGEEFGVKWYTKEKDLIKEPDIEAVYIATPAYLHFSQAIECLKANKHVLIEKPMALKIDQCHKIIQLGKYRNLKIGVDFMMRFHGVHEKIKEMIKEGKLGRPVMARAQLSCWYPKIKGAWRQIPKFGGGGSLIDMGSHCIDIIEFIFGSKVKEVFCFAETVVQKYSVEDTAIMTVKLKNGAIGIVDACFSIPDNSSLNVLEIYGSKGSVLAKGTIGQSSKGEAIAYLEKKQKIYDAKQIREVSYKEEIKFSPKNIYLSQIESFSDAVLKNKKVFVSGEDGLWNQKIIEAAYKSAKEKKVIVLMD